ncbi:type VI secretion system baseplate subunit TssE [Apirhabdus apintestini]|uniref:type VI secretion system baseplate subunit TssE n=1 Tax=Erwinia sp. HR93 TaxID=3094840 RepID=UPI002ADEF545|nr:type VI secretion system baseplate subunit TssE [Erwinia sp. HR93]MEA1064090.1 type VI secretion system baseplate subunit TssE [Erwinia sp. HR93]WPM86121.1 type VI secretion system baseplate subunit TssE [Enterobacteriaceae bacterium CA-0114]
MERKHQYLPTLLDRLQDDEPKSKYDRDRPIDIKGMRSLVQRDLANLLNHTNIEDALDEQRYKVTLASVVNYGVPALIGSHENRHSWNIIEKTIRTAILRFEPRIIPETLLVRSLQEKEHLTRHALIIFEIRGLIYWNPKPIDLCMNGRYDIESEKVELKVL